MSRKFSISTRGLLAAAVVLCVILWAAPSWSQPLGGPAPGKAVFEDTPGVTRSAPPGGSVVLAGDEGGGGAVDGQRLAGPALRSHTHRPVIE